MKRSSKIAAVLALAALMVPAGAQAQQKLPNLTGEEAAARVTPQSCSYIERMAEALAPIEPAQAGRILGVLFDIASSGNDLLARSGSPAVRP